MIHELFWKMTGGRPMKFIREEFMDVVVHRPVNSYMDRCGRYWMAHTAWDWNRMRMNGRQILAALTDIRPEPEPVPQGSWGMGAVLPHAIWSRELSSIFELHAGMVGGSIDAAGDIVIAIPDDSDTRIHQVVGPPSP